MRWTFVLGMFIGSAGCDDLDSSFGTTDQEVIAIRIADPQPASPDHGVIVNIELFLTTANRLLDVDLRYGSLTRAGGPTGENAFCQKATKAGSWIVPVIVLPDDEGEAVLEARLLDGQDATTCAGTTLDSIIAPIAARPGATPPDAGINDAGASDAQ